MITLLCGFAVGAPPGLIVNETFDPPTLMPLEGWQSGGVQDITREYVSGGFAGSTAAKMSATFTDATGYVGTFIYVNDVVMGNDLATPESTVLSLDLKVDQSGLTGLRVYLRSLSGYAWEGAQGLSWADIPVGSYTPGKFQTVVVPLDDPLWQAAAAGPFDLKGKTYHFAMLVGGWLTSAPGPIAVTIDNLRISTKNFMLPWKSTSSGQLTMTSQTTATVLEVGFATYVGAYTNAITFDFLTSTGLFELTAADGNRLFGFMGSLSDTELAFAIEGGTGRLAGVTGTYLVAVTWTEYLESFTATATGAITGLDAKP